MFTQTLFSERYIFMKLLNPIEHASDLGALVKARRKASGLTLLQAAPSCGVSVKFLQALETGKPTIQFDKALGVARHFGIQLTGPEVHQTTADESGA